jgi:hypothetical protein
MADIEAAGREVADTVAAPTDRFISAAKPGDAVLLDWMLELEQRLRIARLRLAIEGDHVIPQVYEMLAGLAVSVHEKLD